MQGRCAEYGEVPELLPSAVDPLAEPMCRVSKGAETVAWEFDWRASPTGYPTLSAAAPTCACPIGTSPAALLPGWQQIIFFCLQDTI